MPYMNVTTDNRTELSGRIAWNGDSGRYVYVVAVMGEEVWAVALSDDMETSTNVTLPLASFDGSWSYALGDFPGWVEPLARHFRNGAETTSQAAPEALAESDVDERIRVAVADRESALRAEFEAWKANATMTAHEYADNNDLCGEFDRCMEEIGLDPRTREFEVNFTLSYSGSVTITARNEDDAAEQFSESPGDYLYSGDLMSYADVSVDEVYRA